MAIFGFPRPRATEAAVAHDAVAAVDCALAMEARLRELNRGWRERSLAPGAEQLPAITMRIGIFTGDVLAGVVGGAERLEYTVIGQPVNIASRLESFDKEFLAPDLERHPCRILVGEPTFARLGGRFEVVAIGDVQMKGKEEKLTVYRIVRRLATTESGARGG
jgi:adenylate cyclase